MRIHDDRAPLQMPAARGGKLHLLLLLLLRYPTWTTENMPSVQNIGENYF